MASNQVFSCCTLSHRINHLVNGLRSSMIYPFLNSSVTKTNVSSVNKKCSLAGLVALEDLKQKTIRSTRMNKRFFHDLPNRNVGVVGCSYFCNQSEWMANSMADLTHMSQGSISMTCCSSSSKLAVEGIVATNGGEEGSESDFWWRWDDDDDWWWLNLDRNLFFKLLLLSNK